MLYYVTYGEKGLRYNMYIITQEEKKIEDVTKTTYGIQCDGMTIDDVSTSKEEVIRLIDKLSKYGLSPCHLQDVIEDFIQE